MMGNETDAEEVTQSTWVKAWQKLDRFNHTSEFSTWLHRIAVNTALDALRRRKGYWSRFKQIIGGEDTAQSEKMTLANNDQSSTSAPSHELIRNERNHEIHQAIASLPEAQRTTLVLKEFEDYSYEQIAQILGCKIGTVMSRLHLARQKLKSRLSQNTP